MSSTTRQIPNNRANDDGSVAAAIGGDEAVVVIHGLGSNRVFMLPTVWGLKRAGMKVYNFGYSSFFKTIPKHAQRLQEQMQRLEAKDEIGKVHIVAHSLGSIITRQMLCSASFEKLGRVVMMAPPNRGSVAATRLSRILPLSETVRQLSDADESFVQKMPVPQGVEIGVLAASYDFVVTDESSHLPTERDHVTIFSGHNGLLVRPSAVRQVLAFLRQGEFLHELAHRESELKLDQ